MVITTGTQNGAPVKRLAIFDNFLVDSKLPKFVKKNFTNKIVSVDVVDQQNWTNDPTIPSISFGSIGTPTIAPVMRTSSGVLNFNGIMLNENVTFDPTLLSLKETLMYANTWSDKIKVRIQYLFYWLYKKVSTGKVNSRLTTKTNYVTLIDFFNRIPFENLNQSKEIIKYYEDALIHVNKTGQVALKEKLEELLKMIRNELILIDRKIVRYVSEQQAINFYTAVGSEKLKLTWIENFVKIIPTNVLELKQKADELEVFDNYVIMHYDPNNDATSLTKKRSRDGTES